MNDEFLEQVVDFANNVDKKTHVDLYFCTNGGYTYVAEVMIRILSPYKNLKLFLYDDISSSGLYFTLALGAPVEIIDRFLTCTIHLPYMDISTTVTGKVRRKIDKSSILESEFPWLNMLSSYLTSSELEQVKEGEDVHLTYDRLSEIYEKVNSKKGRKV